MEGCCPEKEPRMCDSVDSSVIHIPSVPGRDVSHTCATLPQLDLSPSPASFPTPPHRTPPQGLLGSLPSHHGRHSKALEKEAFPTVTVSFEDEEVPVRSHIAAQRPGSKGKAVWVASSSLRQSLGEPPPPPPGSRRGDKTMGPAATLEVNASAQHSSPRKAGSAAVGQNQ